MELAHFGRRAPRLGAAPRPRSASGQNVLERGGPPPTPARGARPPHAIVLVKVAPDTRRRRAACLPGARSGRRARRPIPLDPVNALFEVTAAWSRRAARSRSRSRGGAHRAVGEPGRSRRDPAGIPRSTSERACHARPRPSRRPPRAPRSSACSRALVTAASPRGRGVPSAQRRASRPSPSRARPASAAARSARRARRSQAARARTMGSVAMSRSVRLLRAVVGVVWLFVGGW